MDKKRFRTQNHVLTLSRFCSVFREAKDPDGSDLSPLCRSAQGYCGSIAIRCGDPREGEWPLARCRSIHGGCGGVAIRCGDPREGEWPSARCRSIQGGCSGVAIRCGDPRKGSGHQLAVGASRAATAALRSAAVIQGRRVAISSL